MTLEAPHLLPHFRPHVGQKRFVGRVHGTGEHEVVPDGDAQLVGDLIGMKETSVGRPIKKLSAPGNWNETGRCVHTEMDNFTNQNILRRRNLLNGPFIHFQLFINRTI
jgi:hypothetical protein